MDNLTISPLADEVQRTLVIYTYMPKQDNNQLNTPNIKAALPADLLGDDEQVLLAVKSSIWTVAFLSFRTIIICGALITGAIFIAPLIKMDQYGQSVIRYSGLAIIARIAFALIQWLSRSYVLTDRRVIRLRGVFTIDVFQCSLTRVQNTFMIFTLPQRILGLGSIAFTTAGTDAIEAIWHHVNSPLKLHNIILKALNAAESSTPNDKITP